MTMNKFACKFTRFALFAGAALFASFSFAQSGMEKVGPQIEGSFFQDSVSDDDGVISRFANVNNQIYLGTLEDAFNIYMGAWNGMQRVSIDGTEQVLVEAKIIQRNLPSDYGNVRRMIGNGKVIAQGQSLDIRSMIYMENGFLVTEIRDERDGRVKYRGRVKQNRVSWEPYCLVFLCDFQIDSFFIIPNGVLMDSVGLKQANMPNFNGYFMMTSSLTKMESAFSSDSVKSRQEMRFDGSFK